MTAYSFKKEAKVYIVYNANKYNIDISDINFSQTFQEESYKNKTLHNPSMFEGSVISKANPANFDFIFPAIREDEFKVVFDRALDYQAFDLYVETQQDVFKVRNCVITNGTFIIEKLRPLSMQISGEASQVSRAGDAGVFTIPGVNQPRAGSMTYNRLSHISITLGGSTVLSEDLVAVSVDLQNNIKWTPYEVITGCSPATITLNYPETYAIDSRSLSGTITRYLTDTNNAQLLGWGLNTSLNIEVGQNVSGTLYGFTMDMSSCAYTNRLNTGDIYTQSYEWRLTQNPTNLSDIITYTTL